MKEDCDRLWSEAQQHDCVRSPLTNNNIMSHDYNSVNSSFGIEVPSMKSTELSVSLTQGKRKRRKGALQTIIDTLHGTKSDNEGQAVVLEKVLHDKHVRSIVERAGLIDRNCRELATSIELMQQTNRFIGYATTGQNQKGRATDDQRGAVESIVVATSATPVTTPNVQTQPQERQNKSKVSKRAKAQLFVIPLTTYIRKGKIAAKKWLDLKLNKIWSSVTKRNRWSKIPFELRSRLQEWITNHPDGVNSPLYRDMLWRKKEDGTREKIPKLLITISTQQLHNDMLESHKNGGLEGAKMRIKE